MRRATLPLSVFTGVFLVHYFWSGLFPERDPIQDRWASLATPANLTWLYQYISNQSYWLGYSYGLSLAFAAVALRRYRQERSCTDRNLALGGLSLSGFLALAGCFLAGCCGSPMLIVYLNLFGASFLPLAKPLLAGLTTVSILGAWWWMNRRGQQLLPGPVAAKATCQGNDCSCDGPRLGL